MAIAFLDFEASGLGPDSYPIEVAWGFFGIETTFSYLIRPAEHWTDWDPVAEDLHELSRATLFEAGATCLGRRFGHEQRAGRLRSPCRLGNGSVLAGSAI